MKTPKCKNCGREGHYAIRCMFTTNAPIRPISEKTYSRKQRTDRLWYELNPPDEKGTWTCYLQISRDCPITLTRSTITLEHVKSKARHPELKFDVTNIKPACSPCNKLKGSLNWDDELMRLT